MVQSNGNGKSENPEIEATFEPIDDETQQVQDRWVKLDKDGRRGIAFSDEIRDGLGIEDEDDESESD